MTPKEQVFADIVSELKINGQATIRGFGSFTVNPTAARQGRNPRTGEVIQIPAGHRVSFKPAKALKELF